MISRAINSFAQHFTIMAYDFRGHIHIRERISRIDLARMTRKRQNHRLFLSPSGRARPSSGRASACVRPVATTRREYRLTLYFSGALPASSSGESEQRRLRRYCLRALGEQMTQNRLLLFANKVMKTTSRISRREPRTKIKEEKKRRSCITTRP